jgi:hypothetical protein
MDQAAVRLTAAAGLLRLARSHDDAVPVALFHRIALTLQVATHLLAGCECWLIPCAKLQCSTVSL